MPHQILGDSRPYYGAIRELTSIVEVPDHPQSGWHKGSLPNGGVKALQRPDDMM